MRLKIGARQSDLARVQAVVVAEHLRKIKPELQIEFYFKTSLGDQRADEPLWQAESKGLFTQDFYDDLINGTVDLVVHSWKDLPTEPRAGTCLAATLAREDSRDILLMPKSRVARAPKKIKVLTSSPRRVYAASEFLKKSLPWQVDDLEFIPVRGNVPTRIRKLLAGEGDILFVAKAALDRLLTPPTKEFDEVATDLRGQLEQCAFQVLPLSAVPTAAAQGALAIEVAEKNITVLNILKSINDAESFECASREREILRSHGGGCHQKIGVSCLQRPYGQVVFVRGQTQSGVDLSVAEIKTQWPKPNDPKKFFPLNGEGESFFRRRSLQTKLTHVRNWWVARDAAVPMDMSAKDVDFLWTAGVKTWLRLAERGFWVHGTADSLGEQEPPAIDTLVGKPIVWTKLTHSGSTGSQFPVVATYELQATQNPKVDFSQKTHFYWMSGSQFLRSIEIDPTIVTRGFHASGPGLTADVVRGKLTGSAKHFTLLRLDQALNL